MGMGLLTSKGTYSSASDGNDIVQLLFGVVFAGLATSISNAPC